MIARRLRSYLAGIAEVADALSAPPWGVKIFVSTVPQNVPLPYVRLAGDGGRPDYHLAGEIGDLAKRVQCDVWASSADEADRIAELIRLAPLSGFHGRWTDEAGNVTQVKAVTIQTEIDTFEDPRTGSDEMRYRNAKEYSIHHERPVN
jgi:hypothetical protein